MRTEDKKLLQGQGSYVDDVHLPNMLQAAVLRSPHAHAKIVSIDCTAARELKGVHAVYTHADLTGRARGRAPSMLPNPAIRFERTQELLTSTEVTFAGEAVAFVVADNRYIAEDACGLIEVEYDPLPAVAECRSATPTRTTTSSRILKWVSATSMQPSRMRRTSSRKPTGKTAAPRIRWKRAVISPNIISPTAS